MDTSQNIKYALLTGFEPFGTPRPRDNRSWETVKQLSGERILAGGVTVVCHCHELPVSYGPVSELVPQLHLGEQYSIVIHCGAGSPGVVKLEGVAHRDGYSKQGNGGTKDVPDSGCVPGYSTAKKLSTPVNVDALKRTLAANGWASVVTSQDAGRYLCEFTYYTSLAEGETSYAKRQLPVPKTLFMHIPPKMQDPYSDSELANLVRDIIRNLA
ncbi:pyroglutamyl-peptidase activity protein [Kickxella alabastrina]|uniref:Pyroglutamyl-peptidase activity protein n=1 Tax=Kickxella alabastrina TaxID=61397 RepID=A0ACC1IC96_9FUNG|nr:pyroglutamyl-peptidase activity protein [Kickxella alabastrina]